MESLLKVIEIFYRYFYMNSSKSCAYFTPRAHLNFDWSLTATCGTGQPRSNRCFPSVSQRSSGIFALSEGSLHACHAPGARRRVGCHCVSVMAVLLQSSPGHQPCIRHFFGGHCRHVGEQGKGLTLREFTFWMGVRGGEIADNYRL